jgi:hypothetical protein
VFVDPLSSDRIEQEQIDATRERRLASCADVKVVAELFVVQAESKDGDPVLMAIGPQKATQSRAAKIT